MQNVPTILGALFFEIAPDGVFSEEEVALVHGIHESVTALVNGRRSEQVAAFVPIGGGRYRYDPHATPTPEQAEAGERNRREMAESGRPPIAPRVKPEQYAQSLPPMHPHKLEYLLSGPGALNNVLKATGRVEVSKTDLMQDRAADKRTPVATVTQDEIERVFAHMSRTGQLKGDKLDESAKVIPMEAPKAAPMPRRPRVLDSDLDTTALEEAPGPGEIGGADAVVDVPLEERAEANLGGTAGMIGAITSHVAAKTPGALRNLMENGLAPRAVSRKAGA